MTHLIGLDFQGSELTWSLVDRRGQVLDAFVEPLESSVDDWWTTHPETYFRGLTAALERSFREGRVRPGQIASIGLTASHGVVLLDAEMRVTPPREIDWARHGLEEGVGCGQALRSLAKTTPRAMRRSGVVFSLLDYLRFRMTGALATHESFAVETGLLASPASLDRWSPELLEELKIPARVLPPIFSAGWKVGVVTPELIELTGVGKGVWVMAGSDPISARLFVAVEPVLGTRLLYLDDEKTRAWQVCTQPDSFESGAIPLARGDMWYQPIALPDCAVGCEAWPVPVNEQWTIDSPRAQASEDWTEEPQGDVWYAWDCGQVSAGTAVQAGLGLGWWRDLRGLWRKGRSPVSYSDFKSSL